MKIILHSLTRAGLIFFCVLLFNSCSKSVLKLSVPQVFKEQATAVHVNGSRSKNISFANFSTSKIKRGVHVKYPGWGRGFFLENIVLNHFGLRKEEHVEKEKDRFRYTLSNGKQSLQVFGKEQRITRSIEYSLTRQKGLLSSVEQVQQHSYIFSAVLSTDTAKDAAVWELVMTNFYDRKKDGSNSLFTIIRPDDNGLATNGKDSVFIKPISTQKAERPDGREGKLLFKVLVGYELSTPDGVIAIIDMADKNIWFYNELEEGEKLVVSGIATALFARRVNDLQW